TAGLDSMAQRILPGGECPTGRLPLAAGDPVAGVVLREVRHLLLDGRQLHHGLAVLASPAQGSDQGTTLDRYQQPLYNMHFEWHRRDADAAAAAEAHSARADDARDRRLTLNPGCLWSCDHRRTAYLARDVGVIVGDLSVPPILIDGELHVRLFADAAEHVATYGDAASQQVLGGVAVQTSGWIGQAGA